MTPESIFLSAYLTDCKEVGLYAAEAGITPKHFADQRFGELFRIAQDEVKQYGTTSRLSLVSKVESNNQHMATLAEVPSETLTQIGRSAIREIANAHARKIIRWTAQSMLTAVEDSNESADVVIASAQKSINELATLGGSTIKTLATDRAAKVDTWKAARDGQGVCGIPTPWHFINSALGGLRPRTMSVLGAFRGTGKSSASRQIAYSAATEEISVGLLTLEDPSDIASAHIASLAGNFSPFHLDRGDSEISPEQADKSWGGVEHLPIVIYDRPSTISQIENICTAMKAQNDTKLIIIDHIQYILPEKTHQSRNEEVAQYSMRIAALAKRLDCHILVCSQLSRSSEKEGRPPRLSDLRDSGAIEQDARQVIMLYQDKDSQIELCGKYHDSFVLEVAKNNYGRSGDKVACIRTSTPLKFDEVKVL